MCRSWIHGSGFSFNTIESAGTGMTRIPKIENATPVFFEIEGYEENHFIVSELGRL